MPAEAGGQVVADAAAVAAVPVTVERLEIEPEQFGVGQAVIVRVYFSVAGSALPENQRGSGLAETPPAGQAPTVRSMELRQIGDTDCLVFELMVWQPGLSSLSLPAFGGYRFPLIELTAASLPAESPPPAWLPPAEMAGFRFQLYLALIAAVLVVALLVTTVILLPGRLTRLRQRWRRYQAWREFDQLLRSLEQESAPSRAAWFALAGGIKRYFQARLVSTEYRVWLDRFGDAAVWRYLRRSELPHLPALTAAELALLPDGLLPAAAIGEIVDLLRSIEAVCWAGAGLPNIQPIVDRLRRLHASFETGLKAIPAGWHPGQDTAAGQVTSVDQAGGEGDA